MIWEPFILALVLGFIVSAGLYFAYLWPSVEPVDDAPAHPPGSPERPPPVETVPPVTPQGFPRAKESRGPRPASDLTPSVTAASPEAPATDPPAAPATDPPAAPATDDAASPTS